MPKFRCAFAAFVTSVSLTAISVAAELPTWAYLVPSPADLAVPSAPDDGNPRHVPNSTVALTRKQFAAHVTAVPDWHPDEHPAMPGLMAKGREPQVWACAYCHLPNGAGRPENASLAGLPAAYIKQQLLAFKNGDRPGSEPRRAPQNFMIAMAKNLTAAEIDQAAAYFSALKPESFITVIESATVPKSYVAGAMLAKLPGGEIEPLGYRIIEMPEDLERAENRDSKTTYVAYVPLGSIQRGANLVTTGAGKTQACSNCHGPDLKGMVDIPRLAGRSPSYLMRQLYDVQTGTRTGSSSLMKPIVANLSLIDLVAISAYLASRKP
jgi:cytochrome c553